MSCQPPHWPRRNVSPASSKQGPVRATVPVSMMRQCSNSPPKTSQKKESSSPVSAKNSDDDSKIKKKRRNENPSIFLGAKEKSKTLNLRSKPPEPCIRRAASLDAIYIASQWQPNTIVFGYCGRLMIDKATQTPEEWAEADRKKAQWKGIVSAGDQLEVKYIRQKLQRTNQNSRMVTTLLGAQRQSPVQGNHSAISASTHYNTQSVVSPLSNSHVFPASNVTSGPIPIVHGVKVVSPRLHNSVEGLNQEIEKLVLNDYDNKDKDGHNHRVLDPTPEGHRAPIAKLFHSMSSDDFQSYLAGKDNCYSSGMISHSHSISPGIPIIPGNPDISISPHSDEGDNGRKLGTSPRINQFLARGPPDGCEKVKIIEEPRARSISELYSDSLLKPKDNYVLLPSQSSAFYPLYKNFQTSKHQHDTFNVLVSSLQMSANEDP